MKKLLVSALLLALFCFVAAGCQLLPESITDKLGLSSDGEQTNDTNDNLGATEDATGDNTENEEDNKGNGGILHVHKYTSTVTPPTCTEKGYTTHTCDCGKSYTDTEVKALGHNEQRHTAKAATCTEDGWQAYVTCLRCDYSTKNILKAKGHTTNENAFYEMSKDESGIYVSPVCSGCGKLYNLYVNELKDLTVTSENKELLGTVTPYFTIPCIVTDNGEWYKVTAIGDKAFKDNMTVTDVTIPDTVTAITDEAFSGCMLLSTINFGSGVTEISNKAFKWCQSLTELVIPEGITVIGNNAFESCSVLKKITLPETLVTIGDCAFKDCVKLSSQVVIPDNVTTIGDYAFSGCKFSTMVLGKSVVSIGESAFAVASNLNSLYYAGTKEEFKAIYVAAGNEKFSAIQMIMYSGQWYFENGVARPK